MMTEYPPTKISRWRHCLFLSLTCASIIISSLHREMRYISLFLPYTFNGTTIGASMTLVDNNSTHRTRHVQVDDVSKQEGNTSSPIPPSTFRIRRKHNSSNSSSPTTMSSSCSSSSSSSSTFKFWNDGNVSYVQTDRFLHSYPIQDAESHPFVVSQFQHRHRSSTRVRVVYYINTKVNPNYSDWIYQQFAVFGKHPVKDIYIVADATSCADEKDLIRAYHQLRRTRSNRTLVHLDCYDDDVETYEYHGIRKLWEIGQTYSGHDDVAVYFHSKGMTHASTWGEYVADRVYGHQSPFTQALFSQPAMDRIVEAFQLFPTIVKAGVDCAEGGWVWYNFFYVRGTYLSTVEHPIITDRRHYYEDWVGRSGGPDQPGAPYVPERDYSVYDTGDDRNHTYNGVQSCYALGADSDPNAANMGYYYNPFDGKRYLVS